jgi:ATP-dependent Lon protease
VLFIATANDLSTIQPALRDRMEIIPINGYTVEEKVQISKKHLIPKLISEHGFEKLSIKFTPKLIEKIISSYTNESGVRGLNKRLAKVIRNRAKQIAFDEKFQPMVNNNDIQRILGPGLDPRRYTAHLTPGVVTGLAWTRTGGDILFIETSKTKGKGKLTLTGNLGDVMKESAHAALSYVLSRAKDFGLKKDFYRKTDIHIHIPEGAVPKDGPSAGITMAIAMVSALTKNPLRDVAMTGELTLTGKVLPIGGLKEKSLAAHRGGIFKIILPKENEKDIPEIPDKIRKKMSFYPVSNMDEAIKEAFEKKLRPGKKPAKTKTRKQQASSRQQPATTLN